MKNFFKLIVSILLPFIAGGIGSFFTMPNIPTWYATLNRPSLSPPNWIFGPVWTILYIIIGISLFLVWRNGLDKKGAKIALVIFLVQLVLNSLWSILFFGLQNPLFAFIEIIFLWIFILLMIISFYRISKVAGLILIPYILWVSFAGYLNFMIWILN